MSRYITVKDNRDFARIYKKGRSCVSPVLVTYALKNRTGGLRYGITTGKKVGNAVRRSRARRVIRASYYSLFDDIKPGFDLIFVARGKTPHVKMQVVHKAMRQQLSSMGLLNRQGNGDRNEKDTSRTD